MSNILPFAQRTDWVLTPNKLSNDIKRLRRENVPILDLTETNPTKCDFSYLNDEIIKPLSKVANLSYAPDSRGNDDARIAICQYYKEKSITVLPSQILLTSSTSEAYSYLFRLLINHSEQILFPRPSYPLFSFLSDLNDVQMDTYPLRYKDQWRIDFKSLRDALSRNTKALVVVNPNNPTGSYVQSEEIEAINILCEKDHISLICDEVFSDFAFDQNKNHPSFISNNKVLTFVLGGISKTLGLPQMKLSWIIVNGPPKLAQEAIARLEVIADTYLSVNTFSQNALPIWLSRRDSTQNEIRSRIINNYNTLKNNTELMEECELLVSEGGWCSVLKINNLNSEEELKVGCTDIPEDCLLEAPGQPLNRSS